MSDESTATTELTEAEVAAQLAARQAELDGEPAADAENETLGEELPPESEGEGSSFEPGDGELMDVSTEDPTLATRQRQFNSRVNKPHGKREVNDS